MGTVETVTILMTDLVGSTGLESRVGPGAADHLRDEHFALLRGAIDDSGGREIKNTGDGAMVAFGSASEAISCAVTVQQRFERRNRSAEEQLMIKIGISLGDVTAADGDYFGLPVAEAARLCDRAHGGQILARDVVVQLAGVRLSGTVRAVGPLELKGLPEPVHAVEVGWQPLGDEAPTLQLPLRLQEMPTGGFVGRAGERRRLAERLDEACRGNRQLVLLSGEPGIGKTRLATHTALEARSRGAVVLYGRCDEELGVPYGPWVEALAHFAEHGPRGALLEHARRHGGEITRLVPELAARIPDLPPPRETDPDTERYLLWGAVVGMLRVCASRQPLVLVLDDLHWADKQTLLLLRHVVTSGQGIQALIIGTYRESEIARGHPLADVLAALHREQGVQRFVLKGLSQHDIAEIMERAAGHDLDEPARMLADELFRETDGNPFYAGELLRHLLESGGIYKEDGDHWTVRGSLSQVGLPESVREVLGRRVERLGEETRSALSVAAVIGRDFDVGVLALVTERPEEELLRQLEEAVAASVLTESPAVAGRFSFAHALINHTLYEELGTTRRARIHQRVGEALERLAQTEPRPQVSELAHHWARATTVINAQKAATYARMAGERALSELAPDDALRWFSQALELQTPEAIGDRAGRCELLIGLGEAQRQTGEPAYRDTLLEASRIAAELADSKLAARAALTNNRGYSSVIGEVDAARISAIERAIALDDPPLAARRARLLALEAQELSWDPDFPRRRALADEAVTLARSAGDERTLVEVLCQASYALWSAETLELRIAFSDELSQLVGSVADPALQFSAQHIKLSTCIEAGEFERAQDVVTEMNRIADEFGRPTFKWFASFPAAGYELLRGDLVVAERLADDAFQLGQSAGESDAVLIYGAQVGYTRTCQGRGAEIVGLLEQSVNSYPAIAAWNAALAWTLCWLDRRTEAVDLLERAALNRFECVHAGPAKLTALSLYADVAAQTAAVGPATVLYELIEPYQDHVIWNTVTGCGHARTWLGLLAQTVGWHDRADEHLQRACEFQEASGLLLWAARAHLGWAEALAARGEPERARSEAGRALALSRKHGYGLFESRAAAICELGVPFDPSLSGG